MSPPKDPIRYQEWLRKVGDASRGRKHSNEHKRKMSEKMSGSANPFYGRKHSKESRDKMSYEHSHITEDTREKIRKAASGIKQSAETIEKRREKLIGKKRSPEFCRKLGERTKGNTYLVGKKLSEEHKEHVRQARIGKKFSEESKKKMSLHHKGIQAKEKHPNWKGGISTITSQIRSSDEYATWRTLVFERDGYKDWFSGVNSRGNIVAHHVIPFKQILKQYNITTFEEALKCPLLWDPDNGITMLAKSHDAYHSMWHIKGEMAWQT